MPAAYGGNGSGTILPRVAGPSARLISNKVLAARKTLSQHSDNLLHTYFGQVRKKINAKKPRLDFDHFLFSSLSHSI
jgi:hypothetical protein